MVSFHPLTNFTKHLFDSKNATNFSGMFQPINFQTMRPISFFPQLRGNIKHIVICPYVLYVISLKDSGPQVSMLWKFYLSVE